MTYDAGYPCCADYGQMQNKITALEELIKLADNLRTAQRDYMANRGNEEKGRAVGRAAAAYDEVRNRLTDYK